MLRTPVVLVLCALASQAWADLRNAPKLRIPPEARRAAVSGQEYEGVLEFTAGKDATLELVQIEGEGWTILSIDPAGPIAMAAGEIQLVKYRAVPSDADADLRLSFVYDFVRFRDRYNIGPKRLERLHKPRRAKRVEGAILDPPRPAVRPVDVTSRSDQEGSVAGGQLLHIVGCIAYSRPGDPLGTMRGADNVFYQIMDCDSPGFDEEMYGGLTEINGCFDVTFNWDDGGDDPDIYLYFETDTGVAQVQADTFLEEDYSWDTEEELIFEDFEGNFIDFGIISPVADEQAALHIHGALTKAFRFIQIHDGIAVEHVEAQWPEDDNGAWYNPVFEEIHIGPNETWNEGTIIHEYGHHYLENYAQNVSPDYCNGFCDDEDVPCGTGDCDLFESGGHCAWCPETDHDAWNEGFPDWMAGAVMRAWTADYGYTPLSIGDGRYAVESLQTCCQDNAVHPEADIVQGYITALLQDIEDPNGNIDDHAGEGLADCNGDLIPDCGLADCNMDGSRDCDCTMDAMWLGVDEIFQIARVDQVITPLEFINAWRARYPQHELDFWSTVRNVSPLFGQYPQPALSIATQPANCKSARVGEPLTISAAANGSLVRYQWRKDTIPLVNDARFSGVHTNTLSINPLMELDVGYYDVRVHSCDNSQNVTSNPVRVHVFDQLGGGNAGISWGRNTFGATGQGAFLPDTTLPNPIVDVNQFTAISPGTWHTVALKSDGTVWSWGHNGSGELGNNSVVSSPFPVQVIGLTDIVRVSAGGSSNLAVKADGKVYAWGSDFYGQLGLPSEAAQAVAVQIPSLDCATSVSVGGYHSMVIKSDGTVWTCGNNSEGQLGLGNFGGWTQVFQQVPGINNAVDGLASNLHSVVLRSDGTLLAWGRNNSGELGDGTMIYRASPVPVIGIDNVRSVHGNGYHTLAVRLDGTVWGWGAAAFTVIANTLVPTQIPGLTNVVEAAGSWSCSAYLRSDGTVWVSGGNYHGGLGISTGVGSNYFVGTPFRVAHIAGATRIAAGAQHFSAIVPSAPPTVVQPPPNQSRLPGQSLAMTVGVTGTPQFQYQWLYNGSPMSDGGAISGATSDVLSINPVAPGNAGNYSVHITNAYGNATSAAGILTISNMSGDVNGDGSINGFDYSAFVACYGAPGIPPNPMSLGLTPQTCTAIFDIGNDGDVDIRNFADFQNAFGG